jgi:Cu-processing system ATP-binding protein
MISVQNITKTFGKLRALDGLSVELKAGQAVSLIGPNASGKTTFIKTLLGMVIPDAGQIWVNGQNIARNDAYRRNIGYMPQIGRYPDNIRMGQLFEMMKDLRLGDSWQATGDSDYNKLSPVAHRLPPIDEELVEAFRLKPMFDKPMRTLSGGTRQKVSAALAFLFTPSVLILDEPTAGLDPVATEILKTKILKEKQGGKLILITSHILSDMDDIASDVLYLMEGKMQFFKPVEQLKSEICEQKLEKIIARIMSSSNQ